MPERLQKIIARSGITSRRKAEELVLSGRVTVNGSVVRELGSQADPGKDTVSVDGKPVREPGTRSYLAMYKPKGCITSKSDPEGRTTVMDLLGPDASKGLFPVGRLDYNTEGLLLLTNDGDFANQVLTARNRVPKTYDVKVSGRPREEAIQRLRDGIKLDGRETKPESIRLLKAADNPWYRITLVEGRNRQIHRMFERVGLLVEKIRRVSIGSLTLRGLEPRQVRELRPKEIERLLAPPPPPPSRNRSTLDAGRSRTTREREFPRERGRKPREGKASAGRPGTAPRAGEKGRGPWKGRDATRSDRPRPSPTRRPSTGGRSPSPAGRTQRASSPARSPARSRGRQSSRPGPRARP